MRIRTVDAFTDRPYTGNPAAVVLLEEHRFPSDQRLQLLAAEMNLAETAYAHPLRDDPEADWALRWFTPATEVDLCGHATVATAHVLHTDGLDGGRTVRFRTRSGVLTARTGDDGVVTLDFPTSHPSPVPSPPGLADALGTEVLQAYDTGTLGDLLVELADEKTVRELAPDLTAVAGLPTRGVIVTARADASSAGYDYVSRFFGPAVGIPEDPVTGSAHTALAPLWSERLGVDTLTGLQASARTGLVRTTLRGNRTEIAGPAVTVLDATLQTDW